MRRSLLLPLLLVGLLGAKPAKPTKPEPAAAPAPVEAPAPTLPLPGAAGLGAAMPPVSMTSTTRLDDAGAEPRRVLGYSPKPGSKAAFETRTSQTMAMVMTGPDGTPLPMPMGNLMPSTVILTRSTVLERQADGTTPVILELADVRVEGGPAEAAGPMAALRGTKFRMTIGADGRPRGVAVEGQPADPGLAAAVPQFADEMLKRVAVFPEEPVGPGAKWTTVMDLDIGGIAMTMTQVVTLAAVEETSVDLETALTMAMGEGGFSPPGMPPGMKLDVRHFEGTGGGSSHVDLLTLASDGRNTVDLDLEVAVPMGEAAMTMGMTMHQTTDIVRVE